jgi:hypothetical protein
VDVLSQIGPFAMLSMLVSVIPLGAAIAYAIRPTERKLVLMRPVSLGVIFAAICALASGASLMCRYLSETSAAGVDMPRVYAGLAESFLPLFVSFGFLAVAWLLVAIGMLRRTP